MESCGWWRHRERDPRPRLLGHGPGLVAAIMALAALEIAYALAVPAEPLRPVTLGLERVTFSPLRAPLIGAGPCWGGGRAVGPGRARHEARLAARPRSRSARPARPGGPRPAKREGAEIGDKQRDLQQTQKRLLEERQKAADARKREAGVLSELEPSTSG
jgi:hypothetical protein